MSLFFSEYKDACEFVLQQKQLLPVSGVGKWLRVNAQLTPARRGVPSAPATCSSISFALPAPLCWLVLEKRCFFTWTASLLVSPEAAQCNDCSTTAWLGQGASPAVQWRCKGKAEPQAEKKQAAVARRNSKAKGNSEGKPASHGCRAHLRDGTRCAKEAGDDASSSSRQMLPWSDVPSKITHRSDQMCDYVSSLRLFLPTKSAAENREVLCARLRPASGPQHVSVQEAGQPSLLPLHQVGSVCQASFPDYQFSTS